MELAEKIFKSTDTIDRFSQNICNYRAFQQKIRTTNGLERINKELKTRSRVVDVFPDNGALLRLGIAILMNINR